MPEQVKDRPDKSEKPEKSLRLQRREERMEQVRKGNEVRRVRVMPANDGIRKVLKHPRGGGFRSSGSTEWPLDTFTKRRIRDGDVTVEERAQNPKSPPKSSGSAPSGGAAA